MKTESKTTPTSQPHPIHYQVWTCSYKRKERETEWQGTPSIMSDRIHWGNYRMDKTHTLLFLAESNRLILNVWKLYYRAGWTANEAQTPTQTSNSIEWNSENITQQFHSNEHLAYLNRRGALGNCNPTLVQEVTDVFSWQTHLLLFHRILLLLVQFVVVLLLLLVLYRHY